MFAAGINMFWARRRLFLARAARRRSKWALRRPQNIFRPKNINSITIIITLEGIEKIKILKKWQLNSLSSHTRIWWAKMYHKPAKCAAMPHKLIIIMILVGLTFDVYGELASQIWLRVNKNGKRKPKFWLATQEIRNWNFSWICWQTYMKHYGRNCYLTKNDT